MVYSSFPVKFKSAMHSRTHAPAAGAPPNLLNGVLTTLELSLSSSSTSVQAPDLGRGYRLLSEAPCKKARNFGLGSIKTRSGPRGPHGPLALAWAAPGHMTWYLPWRTCTYPKAQRAACAHPLARRGLSLNSLNGFSRKPVGLLSGLLTPDPLRGVIVG